MATKLRITWIKSTIGYIQPQHKVIAALGLHRLHETVEHEDSAIIRGMVHKVRHLVKVEAVQ